VIRVLVTDDHPVVLLGVSDILRDDPLIEVVAMAASGEAALAHPDRCSLDVAVLDVALPGMDGFTTGATMRQEIPDLRLVFLTAFPRGSMRERAAELGGALLDKGSAPDVLRTAVRGAASRSVPDEVPFPYGLTVKERAVLGLVCRHLSNVEIAAELGISPETVKTHVHRILRKVGVPDRGAAARLALEEGLVIAVGGFS
jgi:DNA-binding NarL/FixJ family response regulator